MNELEKMWFVMQPHTSSWRVPTESWYRKYLEHANPLNEEEIKNIRKQFLKKKNEFTLFKARERVHEAVHIASSMSENIVFATIPEKTETIYLWLANMLKQPEFVWDPLKASSVVEVFEWWIIGKLNEIELSQNEVKVFIWEENIFEAFSSCSLLAINYQSYNFKWIIWIVGPIRMNYQYNIVVLEEAKAMIEWEAYEKKLI